MMCNAGLGAASGRAVPLAAPQSEAASSSNSLEIKISLTILRNCCDDGGQRLLVTRGRGTTEALKQLAAASANGAALAVESGRSGPR